MKRYVILNLVCVLIAVASLSLAYILAGYWFIIPASLAMALFWVTVKGWSVFRSSSVLLTIFVVLAAIAVIVDALIPLILIACTTALASWDLTNFAQSLSDDRRLEVSLPVEKNHLRSLSIAASIGLTLALITSYVSFKLPFIVTLVLVLIAIGCLTYGLQPLGKDFDS